MKKLTPKAKKAKKGEPFVAADDCRASVDLAFHLQFLETRAYIRGIDVEELDITESDIEVVDDADSSDEDSIEE